MILQELSPTSEHAADALRMMVKCCKCFRNTRKLVCRHCGHYICTSCKEKRPC